MGPLIALAVAALVAFTALALWRGRLVSIALAAAECPDCRVPLVPLRASPARPTVVSAAATPVSDVARAEAASNWEVCVCPRCDRVVTTLGRLPSPVADCPSCHQRSLVVYAERLDGEVVVDEWCDMCGRRGRVSLPVQVAPGPGRDGVDPPGAYPDRPARRPKGGEGRVLPFRRG